MTGTGVVVMAYGTPRSPGEVEAYYTDIRRGRPPTPEQLADLTRRYDAIGGISPLAERTEAQRLALAAALDERRPGELTVVLGQKHAAPFIEDAVRQLADQGITRAVGLVLAPHYSGASVGQYQARAAATGAELGVELVAIDSWHLEPAYLEFLTASLALARTTVPEPHQVLFTAHSLPERSLVDDPYPDQLRQSAEAVAERSRLNPWAAWSIAWQSAGRTPEPWRGPDVLAVIRELGATGRSAGVVVCPQGFTSDHLEVLYDLDIEAAGVAAEAGLAFARTRSLNDDPTVMGALADRVLAAADRAPSDPSAPGPGVR
jgi:protoporphyrin/coproporphyrin ferrochelatase